MPRLTLNRVFVGTLLLPAVFGGLVLWSMSDRVERTQPVPAAVVNLDEPVISGTGEDRQVIYAGRLLAAGLTSPTTPSGSSFDWELADAEEAERGLREGGYYAVITIPEDFSRSVSSVQGEDPRTAEISVESNDAASPLAADASRQVAQVAAARLGDRVTATFLDGLFERSDRLRVELGRAAGAAGQVEVGAERLEQGAGELSSGAGDLAGGLDRLRVGADALASGAERVAGGADRLADGTQRLAGGLRVLEQRTDPLPGQTDRLADGADRVAEGTVGYATLLDTWRQACTRDPLVAAAQPRLCAVTVDATGPTGERAEQLRRGARELAAGTRRLADATPPLARALDSSAAGATTLADGAARLAAGTARLAGGAVRLAGGAAQAGDGARALAGGSEQLSAGTARLGDGSSRLAAGLDRGAREVPEPAQDAAEVVADPVSTSSSTLNPTRAGATALAPAVLAIGLWLGAFVTFLVRRALPATTTSAAAPGWRLALTGWWPAALVGLAQGMLLLAATLLFGATYTDPVGAVLMTVLAVACFAAVTQAFVAALGRRRGWITVIAFTALQVVGLGGLVPIETAPAALQGLAAVLPVTRAADGFGHLTLGGEVGSPVAATVVLVIWGLGGGAVTALAARRRQRLTVAQVRRAVRA